ncbi:TadE/TadG family type IV pilus assembly protein [Chelativorans sp. AA-79]|uniref:TadE/TadG family type IV pilus assembly protein n=1 Tax=Chelativorans sp. AA-79 TaxID=3028735 RepID=UPI0023F8E99E|nr:TadE/TadG family type IV pilus assembly protein [Chelativorans sp. AA-79]WEX09395.1 pilus assembly protein [Chelativorans sp. AA-79]
MGARLPAAGKSLAQRCAAFKAETRGVAAIEFALVVPLMLALFFLSLEFSQALETDRKVSRLASQVADLVTQQREMTKEELRGLMTIGQATLQPYRRSDPKITVTAIQITDEDQPKPKVVWSRALVDGVLVNAETPGELTEVPQSLLVRGSFLVRANAELDYRPVILWAAGAKEGMGLTAAFDEIAMGERYYLRPRQTPTIPCSDC